jgi:hypothetical protein
MSDPIEFNVSLNEPVNFNLEVGNQGPKGDKGDTGNKGDTGDRGEKGDPGTTDYNQLQNKPQLDIYLKKSEANNTTADLLNKINQNTDSINDTRNSLSNYTLISDVNSSVSEVKSELNDNINQSKTRLNSIIDQAKTDLNSKITEANSNTSSLDIKFTKVTSNNKADIAQLRANLDFTNSALLTHKEQADKKFDDIKVEQSDQDTLISDILNAFSVESEKGTNLKFNTSATKVLGMSIYGNTGQVKTSGKNIIDYSAKNIRAWQCTAESYGNGVKIIAKAFSGVAYVVKAIPNSASFLGKTITVSAKISGSVTQCIIYASKGASTYERLAALPATGGTYKLPDNFPADRDGFQILFYVSQNSTSTVTDVQVELGNTATDYEPYTGGYNNLFDEFSNLPIQKNSISLTNQNGLLKLSGKPDADWVPLLFRDLNGLLDKTTYTVVAYNQNTTQLFSEIMLYKKDGSGIDKITAKGQKIFTFTTDSTKYNRYAMKLGLGPVSEFSEPVTIYNNYALFIGNYNENNLPEYSPYNQGLPTPRPQYSQVVKELNSGNIKVVNKNFAVLENKNYTNTDLAVQVNTDGSITAQGENKNFWGMNITTNNFIGRPLKKGDVVTLSVDRPLPYTIKWYAMRDDNTPIDNFCNIQAGETTKTAIIPANLLYGRLFFYIPQVGLQVPPTTFKVQLEYGDTATQFITQESSEFTIPSGVNLYKLTGTVYDEIKLENGVAKMIKRVGKIEFTGEESIIVHYFTTSAGTIGFKYKNPSGEIIFTQQNSKADIICSHLSAINEDAVYTTRENKTGVAIYGGYNNFPKYSSTMGFWFTIPDQLNLGITDVASFKNWLKSEKAKGTPVTVYYEMKTPTEEEITDPTLLSELKKLMKIRTYDGPTNILVTGTGLTPEIKIKYMRKIN